MSPDSDPYDSKFEEALETIREHPENVQRIASWSGQVGAAVRVLAALANDEDPAASDLKGAGFVRDDDDLDGRRLS
ncbi:hypothetical protein MUK72_16720 (plasmid) [Halococcus dombrowskii]|uniref:Uncharacterized protein n=1 Tax=Halococcus dombrowskii TaxID=179637 RepID=A0AAV3SKQ7_HALDO|nr:hypothetical protein [Halococcus dombrowskii]UOO97074.1 hypothetical protein MUK72_16720 [Halococcus dombrowskii]